MSIKVYIDIKHVKLKCCELQPALFYFILEILSYC